MTDADAASQRRSGCPITATLELIGDKWSLIVIRDLLVGKRRFNEFMSSPERITTNILADRLSRLEQTGLVTRTSYSEHPPRFEYALTEKGRALHPLLQEICRWGNRFIADTWTPPASFMADTAADSGSH